MILTMLYESQFIASVLQCIFIVLAITIEVKILNEIKKGRKYDITNLRNKG